MLDQLKQAWERLRSVKGFTTWLWVIILFVILAVGLLMNEPLPAVNGEDNTGSVGSTGLALSVFLRWMAVIGLVYIAFIFIRRWQGNKPGQTQRRINVLERFYVSPKQVLYIVNVDGREFFLGATDSSINLIAEMNSDELRSQPIQETREDFESLLRNKKEALNEADHE
ncbi:hypothetical protein hrd7_17610 [Leptolinea sp. HRD-7]|nr:hypothetical protein hrd7_17610 [Leptolinea sp. HRD-7]